MTDPGSAGTPQLLELGITPGVRLRIIGAPPDWSFAEPLDDVHVVEDGSCDVALVFVREAAELRAARRWGELVYPAGACWVAWPRKAGGHASDVDDDAIRTAAIAIGLVDVKVAAIDDDWSGLKIVWRRENRTTGRISKQAVQDALHDDAS